MDKVNGFKMASENKNNNDSKKHSASIARPSLEDYLMIVSKRLMTVLIGFSRQSTIHSISHLAQARNFKQRLFWLFIAFCASIGFLINLINIIEKYLERPVLTNVIHDYRSFLFPDITFCSVNPVYFPPFGTLQYLNLERQFHLFHKFRNSVNFSNRFNAISTHMSLKNYSMDIDLSDFLFIQDKLDYSHPPWSAVFYCKYMQANCSWKHFEVRHIWPYGNCFTFNVSKIPHSRDVKSMIKNAWRPDFKIIVYKSLTPPAQFQMDPFNNLNTPGGVLVMIHEADTYPFPDEGFIVDSYTQIDLKITTKIHVNVNNKCDVDRETFDYFDIKSKKFATFAGRQPDCIFEVIQSSVANKCGCLLQNIPVLNKFRHMPFCLELEVNETNVNVQRSLKNCIRTSFQQIDQGAISKKCHRDLCSHPSFSTVVSHSKYPAVKERQTQSLWLRMLLDLEKLENSHFNRSDLYLKALKKDLREKYNISSLLQAAKILDRNVRVNFLDEAFVDKNFMQIRIVPSSLFMDHIEETLEYTLSRLLGDIGGCVGLWIGASLITIFEFVDLMFRFGDLLASYRYRPNVKSIGNTPATKEDSAKINPLKKFQCLSEDETGDLEDELNVTLMQPLSLVKGSRSYFFKQLRIEDV